mmetsp:Transcript_35269/g.85376  ORF Transcript_35269/g.85376 Transcript_35269/m.85376 type:complete len:286 (-) Transcript_35269:62-919(-)
MTMVPPNADLRHNHSTRTSTMTMVLPNAEWKRPLSSYRRCLSTWLVVYTVLALNSVTQVSGFFQNFLRQQQQQKAPTTELKEIQSLIDAANTPPNNGKLSKPQEEELKSLMMSINREYRSRKEGKGGRSSNDPRRLLPTTGNDEGYWDLLYTTEKEVNFFKTSWPFKDALTSITQTLDLYDDGIINNSINFNGGKSYFAVDGTVRPAGAADREDENSSNDPDTAGYVVDRVEFTFTKATICFNENFKFETPPVGAGWFDTLWCDGTYRLSYDSRGDYSVFIRRNK